MMLLLDSGNTMPVSIVELMRQIEPRFEISRTVGVEDDGLPCPQYTESMINIDTCNS